jgi:hypothetical protein
MATVPAPRPWCLEGPLGLWRPADRLLAAYTGLSLAALLWGLLRGVPGCGPQILADLAVLAGSLLVQYGTRDTRRFLPTLLRVAYVPILYWFFYKQIETLWPVFHAAPLDGGLAALEGRLFGGQASLAFRPALPFAWVSELLCLAYFGYYFFTPVLGLTALFRRGYLATERIIFASALCFFICYTLFWLFPTVGPHFWFPPHRGPELYDGYLFNHLLFGFTRGGEIRGGAFPSSHIAVALVLTLSARREAPGLFPFLAVLTALMLPAVIYLRAHYLLDIPAGLAMGLLVFLAAGRVQRALGPPGDGPGPP